LYDLARQQSNFAVSQIELQVSVRMRSQYHINCRQTEMPASLR
jgi:hypothetical protein